MAGRIPAATSGLDRSRSSKCGSSGISIDNTSVATTGPVMDAVGFAFAYIAAFSLFDLLWFPIAMATAYKFGTGEKG